MRSRQWAKLSQARIFGIPEDLRIESCEPLTPTRPSPDRTRGAKLRPLPWNSERHTPKHPPITKVDITMKAAKDTHPSYRNLIRT